MATGTSLKGHLREYGERPKKRLGQVFLIEPTIQRKILALADLGPEDTVVEIGPGTGALTRAMIGRVRRLIALEIDRKLVSYLHASMDPAGRLCLVCMDALDFPYLRASHRLKASLKVVGNIPYGISAPLLFTFLDQYDAFEMLVLMLQKEVAQRLTAQPGSKAYGLLTVLCSIRFHVRIRQKVPRHCFYPMPAVDSAVIQCVPRSATVGPVDDRTLRKVVKAAFSQRRKTLFNALRSSPFLRVEACALRGALEAAGIDPARRPETLWPEEFVQLARCIPGPADAE